MLSETLLVEITTTCALDTAPCRMVPECARIRFCGCPRSLVRRGGGTVDRAPGFFVRMVLRA